MPFNVGAILFGNKTKLLSSTGTIVDKSGNTIVVGGSGGTGIPGTTTNDSATTGFVGEYMSAQKLRSAATSLTSPNPLSVANITLTPGDWDISAMGGFIFGATTSLTRLNVAISTNVDDIPSTDSNAVPTSGFEVRVQYNQAAAVPVNDISLTIAPYRVTVATATTLVRYLSMSATFTVSTCSAYGYISARRAR